MELPERKKIRLNAYNYSSNGTYFVTICVTDRNTLLWDNAENIHLTGGLPLSEIGEKVEAEIQKLATIYENVRIDHYCIMPDHIHMVICILPTKDGQADLFPTLSQIIKQFKGSITKKIGFSIWQKSFNDHIIRNKKEYLDICRYIDENVLKWIRNCK